MATLSLPSILLALVGSSVSMPLTGPSLELQVDPPAGVPSDTFQIRITNTGTEDFPYINCCSLPRITWMTRESSTSPTRSTVSHTSSWADSRRRAPSRTAAPIQLPTDSAAGHPSAGERQPHKLSNYFEL
jgi:hypothetical protein